jgi:rSAM/selenodomain-associated transferase 2
MALSVIIPVLNEELVLWSCLDQLKDIRTSGAEVIVVDGGSTDKTREVAARLADRVLLAPRGRASQMNAGAQAARGDILLFLHADTALPEKAAFTIAHALERTGRAWGFFGTRIVPGTLLLSIVAAAMSTRSRLTRIATGDQAIFIRRSPFETIGGFPDIPLMEDIAISKALKRAGLRPVCLKAHVRTSARRWQKHGVIRTVMLMWRLRLRYYLGADPSVLAKLYGYAPRED